MKIEGLIWLDEIIEKLIKKHRVNQNEVREVLANRPHFRFVEKGHYARENVYAAMSKDKSSLSRAKSYKEMGDFWDSHDLSEVWDRTKEVEFEVEIESEITYYALDKALSEQIHQIAHKRGVSADTLINLWVQEKLQEQKA